jgi:DNA-binding IclR family transcriptional regulator
VLDRAVRILAAFGPAATALTVADIARAADLPIATAHRMVNELEQHGLLERDADRRLRVGVRLWELATRSSPTRTLREAAMPVMEDLHAVVGHHAQLGVRQDHEVLFVERLSARKAVINVAQIAGRLPLHVSSAGQVLLAHAPVEVQDAVLAGPLPAMTDATITDPRRLRRVLADVRKLGFAFCPGHIRPEATGVAVPIRSADGTVVAALSVVVPNDGEARAVIPLLLASGRTVSRTLGPPLHSVE